MKSKMKSTTTNGGWPAAVAFAVGGNSILLPAHPAQPSHILRLPCSGHCKLTKEFIFSGKRLPPDAIVAKLKRLGWKTGSKLICPSCNGHAPRPVLVEEPMQKAELTSGTALSSSGAMPAPESTARALRRAVVEWLDQAYDLPKQCYKEGFSDATIAKETGTSETNVAKLRDEFFGPAAPPEPKEIRRLREAIEQHATRLEALRQTLETEERNTDALMHRLQELVAKNAWRQ